MAVGCLSLRRNRIIARKSPTLRELPGTRRAAVHVLTASRRHAANGETLWDGIQGSAPPRARAPQEPIVAAARATRWENNVTPTEIDDALRTDRRIEPSAEFRAQVMRAVHARAAVGRRHDRVGRAVWPAVPVTSVVVALLIARRCSSPQK